MSSDKVLQLTDDNFAAEVIEAGGTTLVDFWAEWCMPCKMLAPTIDALAEELEGRIKVGKVDTDSNREVSMKFGISAIPTLIVFKDGQMVKKMVGLQQKAELKAVLEEVLAE